jgi:PBP1b-binding outer membrane lipoprotein LpoB
MSPNQIIRSAAVLLVILAAGCVSSPGPVAELSQAHTLIQQAEQSDAQQFASADLEAARSKLREADARANDQPDVSIRLAQESSVDADLALARTRAAKANQALADVNAGTATLRSETRRSEINSEANQVIAPATAAPLPPPQYPTPQ